MIINSYEIGVNKLITITGKGLHSENKKDQTTLFETAMELSNKELKESNEELKESIVSKLRQIPDYEEEEELEEVDNDTFRQMYQGGLSKSEMEKSATRKFTARVPKIEPKPSKEVEEVKS